MLYICMFYVCIYISVCIYVYASIYYTCMFLYREVHEGRKEAWWMMSSTYAYTGGGTHYMYVPHMYIRERTHSICMYRHIYRCISMYIYVYTSIDYCIFLYLETHHGHKLAWRMMPSTYKYTGEATCYTYVYTYISMYICIRKYWLNMYLFLYGIHVCFCIVEMYDGRKGAWRMMPSLNIKRNGGSLALVGDCLYAIGGFDGDA